MDSLKKQQPFITIVRLGIKEASVPLLTIIDHLKDIFSRRGKLLTELLVLVSVISVYFTVSYLLIERDSRSLVYYGDAISHLVIARQIFDSAHPGLVQLGSVWLPMTHLLLLPFVTNSSLFYTGFAGTIVSSIATAMTALMLFRIVRLQFDCSIPIGLLASGLYIMNPSIIYMGIVPMMEAPFMMFFMISVYYVQKFCYSYMIIGVDNSNKSNKTNDNQRVEASTQYPNIIKAALAISAASLTRYEGWLLPFGFIFVILLVLGLATKRGGRFRTKCRQILPLAIPLSFGGMALWLYYNLVHFKNPIYFLTGPYAIPVRASMRAFGHYLRLNPVLDLAIIAGVAKAMYGLPVIIISAIGVGTYISVNTNNKRIVLFYILTLSMLIAPAAANFGAMLEGSGEIYPASNGGWLDARYIIFIAPFLSFCSVSLLIVFVTKRRKKMVLTMSLLLIIIGSYSVATISQPLEVGKTTVMSDGYTLLPFLKHFQYAFDTGNALGAVYGHGSSDIVLFTPSQEGQQIKQQSKIPLKNFIDVTAGRLWDISKDYPWNYGRYLVIRKPIDIHPDPVNGLIQRWLSNQDILMKYYEVIYQNSYYQILKERK